jgi:hypothetical protein
MAALPEGRWTVEVRALGYSPMSAVVAISRDSVSTARMVLSEKAVLLEKVTVTAISTIDRRTLEYVMTRKRVGFGTFFLPGNPHLERAISLQDLMKYAPGFHIRNDDTLEARVQGTTVKGKPTNRRCIPTIYVDGVKSMSFIPMGEVLAVAAYPDLAGVPVELRDGRNCAVILVWMKH